MTRPVLYDYWRSSASYRVRIALNLLGIGYDTVPVDLLAKQHKSPRHLARNPQGAVPVLDIDGLRLTQSLSIIEYLHETRPGSGLTAGRTLSGGRGCARYPRQLPRRHPPSAISVSSSPRQCRPHDGRRRGALGLDEKVHRRRGWRSLGACSTTRRPAGSAHGDQPTHGRSSACCRSSTTPNAGKPTRLHCRA